jgi:nicotinamide phosphoribosyltransferase
MYVFPPFLTDFYKTGHIYQYPYLTTKVYSNVTARSDKYANVLPDFDHKVVFFGLQGVCQWLLIDLWNKEFFQKPKEWCVAKYKKMMDTALGPNAVTTDHIAALHDLGYLPIRIKALREGSRVDIRVPMFTIINTVDEFYWVTNYLETQLSAETWKSITSATTAYEYKRLFTKYADLTGANMGFVPYQGHDFSMRGMSGVFDATQSGSAHLLSFLGTDTISAIDYLEQYYKATGLVGCSVPSTEHSVMCMGGDLDELKTYIRLIKDVYPSGIVSIVSDTWDFWKVVTEHTVTLQDMILARNGKVVLRPDSGDPVKIICGDPNAEPGSPAFKGAVECLWDIFGGTITNKGFKTLNSHIGLIYGDSITLRRAEQILEGLRLKGFASDNIVLGIGSFTYQCTTRDSFGQAVKATWGVVAGEGRELFKDPKTDDGTKKSLKGLIRVEYDTKQEKFIAYDQQTLEQEAFGLLETVFEDSKMIRIQSLDAIKLHLSGEVLIY